MYVHSVLACEYVCCCVRCPAIVTELLGVYYEVGGQCVCMHACARARVCVCVCARACTCVRTIAHHMPLLSLTAWGFQRHVSRTAGKQGVYKQASNHTVCTRRHPRQPRPWQRQKQGMTDRDWGANETLTGPIKVLQNTDSLGNLAAQHGLHVRCVHALSVYVLTPLRLSLGPS